ncbi:MAG: COG3400 family protein [Helicobacteraceae bacterium]
MKKILIVISGDYGKAFVERLYANYAGESHYDIIVYNTDIDLDDNPLGFSFYHFDPTSRTRIAGVFTKDHTQANLILQDFNDARAVYKILRRFEKSLSIFLVDFWRKDLAQDDENLTLIDVKDILANRLITSLPNRPVIAQHIGLGQGEIMEISVPAGSSYAYRHILNIAQQKWKIAAVYRGGHILLARPELMLRPNDTILAVGQPKILKNVYKAIKSNVGQFPSPYGKNSYFILDLKGKTAESVEEPLSNALNLQKRLNSDRLYVKLLNPMSVEVLNYVTRRVQDLESVFLDVAYRDFLHEEQFLQDFERTACGLIIVDEPFFARKKNKKMLFESKKAVWKLGRESVNELKEAGTFISESKSIEAISSPMLDLSSQLSLNIYLFNITPDLSENKDAVEHFENISSIYERKLHFIKKRGNPVREFLRHKNILQFLPFTKAVTDKSLFDVFRISDITRQHSFMSGFHQIFIPAFEENQ